MGERTLNFGADATDADFQIRDSDPAGGDLIIEHLPTGATFEYDATENAWIPTDPIGTANRKVPGVVSESVSTDDGTIGGDPILGMPSEPVSAGITLGGGWTTIDANQPTILLLEISVNTDGSFNGVVRVKVDYSGGTTVDDEFLIAQLAAEGDGAQNREVLSIPLPAGATVELENDDDPKGSNTLNTARKFVVSS